MPLSSSNGKKYATLDFSQVTEKGLKPLIDALNKNGVTVASVAAPNKAVRKDGVQTKTASLTLQDGQELAFQVNDTGDISAVKLNGRAIPLHVNETLADVARSAGRTAAGNSQKFTDALAKKAQRAVSADLSKKPAVKSTAQQIKEVQEQTTAARARISDVIVQQASRQMKNDAVKAQIEKARVQLTQSQATGTQLEQQLRDLEKQANV